MRQMKRLPPLSIAIPASLVADIPHLREKTFRIGLIGRASAIFRVDEIIIFRDLMNINQSKEVGLISSILSYMETPQYLRKYLFPLDLNLKYVGILPPLRTLHHPLSKRVKDLKLGEYREAVVVKSDERNSYVDIGVEKLSVLRKLNMPSGSRVTMKVTRSHHDTVEVSIAKREEINIYWGYHVNFSDSTLGQIVKSRVFDFMLMTSKYGKPLTKVEDEIRKRWKEANRVLIAFGSPNEGLREILAHQGLYIDEVAKLIVNFIPQQGTETVRTEEAIYAVLTSLNLII